MSLASAVVPSSADASSLSLSLVEDYAAMNKEMDALLGIVLKGTTSSFAIPDIKSTALGTYVSRPMSIIVTEYLPICHFPQYLLLYIDIDILIDR